jgi:hypothetical protein
MSSMNVRLPETFGDAKGMIEGSFDANHKLRLKRYGAMFSNLCDVSHYHIEESDDDEGYANLDLTVTYKMRLISVEEKFDLVEKTRKLRVLNTAGDNQWTYRMIRMVWEGDYPSSVAVDVETGEVFLFSVKVNCIELIEFGVLDAKEHDTFMHELSDREPFKIKIDSDSMFEYIDGAEGVSHLQKNVVVEFDCGMPIEVTSKKPIGL